MEIQTERAEQIVHLMDLALAAPTVPEAVTPILTALVQQTAAVGSAYFQANGEVYHARAGTGKMPEGPVMEAILVHGLPGNTPLKQALLTAHRPMFFDDTAHAPEAAGFPDLGVASLAAAPVRSNDRQLVGAFLMHTFKPHSWSHQEADIFAATASALAGLTARLVAEEQAVDAREGALRALGLALEYRDRKTKGHTDRVTDLALALAQTLGLDDSELTALRWGSYLHDVGKIGIEDAILCKPGRLDDTEWARMRAHSEVGHQFASQLGFLPTGALDVVQYHYERWDGRGYPAGLSGEAIPLTARVFAVCDVYDALTSARPYKPAWDHAEAVAEISRQSGTQFDPAVIAAFLQVEQHIPHLQPR